MFGFSASYRQFYLIKKVAAAAPFAGDNGFGWTSTGCAELAGFSIAAVLGVNKVAIGAPFFSSSGANVRTGRVYTMAPTSDAVCLTEENMCTDCRAMDRCSLQREGKLMQRTLRRCRRVRTNGLVGQTTLKSFIL